MPRVLRTSRANLDLTEIALRIAARNPTAADRWLDTINDKCQLLARLPDLGRKRPDLAPDLRSLPVGNYVIFYRLVEGGVQLIRVLHGFRDIPIVI